MRKQPEFAADRLADGPARPECRKKSADFVSAGRLRAAVTQREAGSASSLITVTQFLDRWINDRAGVNVESKTIERYRELTALYIGPHLGALPIHELRPTHLDRLYAKLLREGGKAAAPFPRERLVTCIA
jgi:integrase